MSEDTEGPTPDPGAMPPPPVDFRILVQSFAGQAMSALGKMPNPMTGQTEVSLPWARYFIDLLGMLEAKTKGNLEPAEDMELQRHLSTLRLTFVDTQKSEEPGQVDTAADESTDA